ncbi:MAG: acetyl-CoA carboxylase biotin carboxyl carrier protein [Lewinellaceae bacterium]|nr:acetyl-CoA carboxylase biotin carboxyl carrier protein [Lewinellaceae bacterium]
MNFNEIQDLIKLVNKSNLTTFKLRQKDFEIVIKTDKNVKSVVMPSVQTMQPMAAIPTPSLPVIETPIAPPASEAPKTEASGTGTAKKLLEIKSPIVGTFYRSPGPEKPAFVKVGDKISSGSVVCIIEAMKLFNEIESDISGTIFKVLVEDASPVEYDQVLFLVEA